MEGSGRCSALRVNYAESFALSLSLFALVLSFTCFSTALSLPGIVFAPPARPEERTLLLRLLLSTREECRERLERIAKTREPHKKGFLCTWILRRSSDSLTNSIGQVRRVKRVATFRETLVPRPNHITRVIHKGVPPLTE